MRWWLSLFSWALRLRWRKGSARYTLGGPWGGYVVPWIKALNWPYGQGAVSFWKFAQGLRSVVESGADYLPDPAGVDLWRTPAEFAANGGGDCEDWASAILCKAVELGVAPDALGWLYLLDGQGKGHIMATLWDGDDLWLADNNRLIPERASQILPAEWAEYTPISWFNGKHALEVIRG